MTVCSEIMLKCPVLVGGGNCSAGSRNVCQNWGHCSPDFGCVCGFVNDDSENWLIGRERQLLKVDGIKQGFNGQYCESHSDGKRCLVQLSYFPR